MTIEPHKLGGNCFYCSVCDVVFMNSDGHSCGDVVYVDDYMVNFGRMKFSHMWSASEDAMEKMARALALAPSWRHNDHYDVSVSKREEAIRRGAIPVTAREGGMIRMMAKRATGSWGPV